MPSVKYQIFVSSTYEDLKAERDQVAKAILEMGHIPVGMEMFSAADEDQWETISRHIQDSDYYVVILAHRYGSTTSDGISFTEKEYDFAVRSGVPVLGFVIDDDAPWSAKLTETDAKRRDALPHSGERFNRATLVSGNPPTISTRGSLWRYQSSLPLSLVRDGFARITPPNLRFFPS